MILLIQGIKIIKLIETENIIVTARSGGDGEVRSSSRGIKFQLCKMNKFQKSTLHFNPRVSNPGQTPQNKMKGQKETSGGDGYIYYLDCSDDIIVVHMYSNSSNCIH